MTIKLHLNRNELLEHKACKMSIDYFDSLSLMQGTEGSIEVELTTFNQLLFATHLPSYHDWLVRKGFIGSVFAPNQDLSNLNIAKANLYLANFYNSNFQGSDLSCCILSSANLALSNFQNAELHRAILNRANLDFASFKNANLTSAILTDAYISSLTDFTGANLQGACGTANLEKFGWKLVNGLYERI